MYISDLEMFLLIVIGNFLNYIKKYEINLIDFSLKDEWFDIEKSDYDNRLLTNKSKKFKKDVIPSGTKKSIYVPNWSLIGKL